MTLEKCGKVEYEECDMVPVEMENTVTVYRPYQVSKYHWYHPSI